MTQQILVPTVCSISELKRNPMALFEGHKNTPIAVLNRNKPVFYCIPPALFEVLLESADDAWLSKVVQERLDGPFVEVNLDDL